MKEWNICEAERFARGELNPAYQEILRLNTMLTVADVPHELTRNMDGWQVWYPCPGEECVCDAVQHFGSYGGRADRLEIMGLCRDGEAVEGWLTAEEVFERIEAHWKGEGQSV